MKAFHPLAIKEVRRETHEAVSLLFEVPENLKDEFRFVQGQYLTFKHELGGEELRRCYSICAGVNDEELRIAVKAIPDGRFSHYANSQLSAGDVLQVFPPLGDFYTELEPNKARRYVAIAGGAGITPMMSLIKTTLSSEPKSSFALYYGNRDSRSIIFMEELAALKDRFLGRFSVTHILSEDLQEIALLNGLLDEEKCTDIIETLPSIEEVEAFFICGPGPMMDAAQAALTSTGVDEGKIYIERFSRDGAGAPVKSVPQKAVSGAVMNEDTVAAVTAIVDGRRFEFGFGKRDESVLEAGRAMGANLPFACKGGVCCTCRAKILEGEADMKVNYALEDDEVAAGYILTCQAVPKSSKLVVSYDE